MPNFIQYIDDKLAANNIEWTEISHTIRDKQMALDTFFGVDSIC